MSHATSIFPYILTLIVLRPSDNPLERDVLIQILLLIGQLNNSPFFLFLLSNVTAKALSKYFGSKSPINGSGMRSQIYLPEGKTNDVTCFVRPCWEKQSMFAVYCLLKVESKFTQTHLFLPQGVVIIRQFLKHQPGVFSLYSYYLPKMPSDSTRLTVHCKKNGYSL